MTRNNRCGNAFELYECQVCGVKPDKSIVVAHKARIDRRGNRCRRTRRRMWIDTRLEAGKSMNLTIQRIRKSLRSGVRKSLNPQKLHQLQKAQRAQRQTRA